MEHDQNLPNITLDTNDRLQILENGWRQGSVVEYSDIAPVFRVCTSFKEVKLKHKAKLLLISQDCDIANRSEDKIECLILRCDSKRVPSLENGQNPRKIQFGPIDENYWYIWADDIIFISKDYFRSNKVSNKFIVPEKNIWILKQWKANRYTRTGLPEKFVSLTKHIFNPLSRDGGNEDTGLSSSELFVRFSSYISSIRVYCIESEYENLKCCFLVLYNHFLCKQDKINTDEIEELFEVCLLERLRGIDEIDLLNDDDSKNSLLESLKFSDVMSDMEFPLGATKMFPRYYFDPESFSDDKGDDLNLNEE
jgi:hypothetical protein